MVDDQGEEPENSWDMPMLGRQGEETCRGGWKEEPQAS